LTDSTAREQGLQRPSVSSAPAYLNGPFPSGFKRLSYSPDQEA
jgi:hypothetical protein